MVRITVYRGRWNNLVCYGLWAVSYGLYMGCGLCGLWASSHGCLSARSVDRLRLGLGVTNRQFHEECSYPWLELECQDQSVLDARNQELLCFIASFPGEIVNLLCDSVYSMIGWSRDSYSSVMIFIRSRANNMTMLQYVTNTVCLLL